MNALRIRFSYTDGAADSIHAVPALIKGRLSDEGRALKRRVMNRLGLKAG